jgi:hypothetical protein
MPKSKINEKIESLKAKINEINRQVREESQILLNEGFTEVFAKYPKLISFSWNQYTPYFNDGDECIFRVNVDSLIPEFTDEPAENHDYEYEKGDSKWDSKSKKYVGLEVSDGKKLNNEAYDELYEIISAIDGDTMKTTYGNHITVTISKNEDGSIEASTDDYNHD